MQTIDTFSFQIRKTDKILISVQSEDNRNIICMIDTGANVPIFFLGENFLKLRFPSAYKTDKLTIITGLGKEPIIDVPVWCIPIFTITDDVGKEIVFHDLLVPILQAKEFSFHMILPLTMLNRTKFCFDYISSVNYATFTIETLKTDFFVKPIYVVDFPKYLNRIQVFYKGELC